LWYQCNDCAVFYKILTSKFLSNNLKKVKLKLKILTLLKNLYIVTLSMGQVLPDPNSIAMESEKQPLRLQNLNFYVG